MSRTPDGLDWTAEVLSSQTFLLALFNDVEPPPEADVPDPDQPPPDESDPQEPPPDTDADPDVPIDTSPGPTETGVLDDSTDGSGDPTAEPVPEPDPETEGDIGGTGGTGAEGTTEDLGDVAQPDLPRLPGEITAVGMRRGLASADYSSGDTFFTVSRVFNAVESVLVNRVGVLSEDGRVIYEQQVLDADGNGTTVAAGESIAVSARITL